MGHAIRSKAVITYLKKKHDVVIVAGGRAYKVLSKIFDSVFEIEPLVFVYENNTVRIRKTVITNIEHAGPEFKSYAKIKKLIKKYKPDLMFTDFEPITFLAARLHGIPLISIDNQHIVTASKVDAGEHKLSCMLYHLAVANYVKADYYFVTTFFYPPLKVRNATLVPPILRQEVLRKKPTKKNHILVYQTSKSYGELIKILEQFKGERFIVYGFERKQKLGNVLMKEFSEKGIINDLASAKAVILNGGFTVLGEALYFKKPVLSVPVKRQFEQTMNAVYLTKMGYGQICEEVTPKRLREFLKHLSRYERNLKSFTVDNNKKLFEKLDSVISRYV